MENHCGEVMRKPRSRVPPRALERNEGRTEARSKPQAVLQIKRHEEGEKQWEGD